MYTHSHKAQNELYLSKKIPIIVAMVLRSRKFILFFLLYLALGVGLVHAEIPIATLLTHTRTEISNDNVLIYNKDKDKLPTTSGLDLYAGDRLDTQSEEVVLIVASNSLIITVQPYTKIEFKLLELGGQEFVNQIIIRSGSVFLDVHGTNDLLQIVDDISAPQQVERNDIRRTEIDTTEKFYTQIININADVISRNVDYSTEVFVTGADFDIQQLIDTMRIREADSNVTYLFNLPDVTHTFLFENNLLFTFYITDILRKQFVNGMYRFNMEKSKFKMSLQLPFIFTKDNMVYNPLGENDLNLGWKVAEEQYNNLELADKTILGADHAVRNLLKKIYYLQYGNLKDPLYFFYGNQFEWNNYKSTMFAYHYKPTTTFENNFNQDVIFNLNGLRIGNQLMIRQFQPASYTDVFFSNYNVLFNRLSFSLANFDLLYNRFWYRPVMPRNATEIGVSIGTDLSVGKLNSIDTDTDTANSNFNKFYVAYTGIDITTPFITTIKYKLEMNFEAGTIFPFSDKGYLYQNSLTNYGGKLGFRNTFYFKNHNANLGFQINGYYTAGFMRPHFAMDGYEYSTRFFYTRSISAMEQAGVGATAFSGSSLSPEIELFSESDFLNVSLGAYYPINISYTENMYQYPAAFIGFSLDLNKWLPPILKVDLDGRYSIQNTSLSNVSFSNQDLFEYNPFSANLNIEFKQRIGLKASIFNTPYYDTDGSLTYYNTDRGNRLIRFYAFSLFVIF